MSRVSDRGSLPKPGDKVVITKQHGKDKGVTVTATVRYVGITKFDVGLWIGVELSKPVGKNDGSVRGVRYFNVAPKCGLFVRPENVTKVAALAQRAVMSAQGHKFDEEDSYSEDDLGGGADDIVGGGGFDDVSPGHAPPQSASLEPAPSGPVVSVQRGIEHKDSEDDPQEVKDNRLRTTDMRILRRMVQSNSAGIAYIDRNGNTRLHHVCKRGYKKLHHQENAVVCLKYLMKNGLKDNLHHVNYDGKTAVMLAAERGNFVVLEFMVSVGADVIYRGPTERLSSAWESSYEDPEGRTAVSNGLAKQETMRNSGHLMAPGMKHKQKLLDSTLFLAVSAGDLELTKLCIVRRARVNGQDKYGRTPLHIAAEDDDNLRVSMCLADNGANIHAKSQSGDTPLLVASRGQQWGTMEYLISIGASVTEKDAHGWSAFKYAQSSKKSQQIYNRGMSRYKENEQKGLLEHINDGDYDDHDFDDTESMLDPDAERDDSSLKKLRWSNANDIQPYYKDPRKSRKKRKGQAVEEEEEDTDTNAIGLEEVLSIPDCRKVLHKYMQKYWVEEAINFLEAVESYQNLFPEEDDVDATELSEMDLAVIRAAANSINEEFIVQSGIQMVNVSADIRGHISGRIATGDYSRDLFDSAGREVFDMVDADVFQGFVQSKEYAKMMANPDIMEAVDEIKAIKASVAAEFADEYSGSDTQNTDDELDDTGTAHIADLGGSADEVPFDSTDMDLLRGSYKAGDDLTVPDEFGNTRLHAIAMSESNTEVEALQAITWLVSSGGLAPFLHTKNEMGETPVVTSAKHRRWPLVEFLISVGADPIYKGSRNALKSAWELCRGDNEGLRALHAGLDAQMRNKNHSVPPMKHRKSLLVKTLFKAVAAADFHILRYLLEERQLSPTETDKDGNTMLHLLARADKKLSLVKYAVTMQCPVDTRNKAGDTPCLIAARMRQWANMSYLIQQGADPNARDQMSGKSVAQFAQLTKTSQQAFRRAMRSSEFEVESDASDEEEVVDLNQRRGSAFDDHIDDHKDSGSDDNNQVPPHREQALQEELMKLEKRKQLQMEKVTRRHEEDIVDMVKAMTGVNEDSKAELSVSSVSGRRGSVSDSTVTYQGYCTGKKTDKRKEKQCSVLVSDQHVEIVYKKGSIFSRKQYREVYEWSKEMVVQQGDAKTLLVVLDKANNVRLKIVNCHASALEEYMVKRITLSSVSA